MNPDLWQATGEKLKVEIQILLKGKKNDNLCSNRKKDATKKNERKVMFGKKRDEKEKKTGEW